MVSDDGSADQTLGIIQEYQRQDARVRLVEGPGKGIKKNVEHALRHTEGDYIFLADQDDIWMPDKVKQVMEAFRRQNIRNHQFILLPKLGQDRRDLLPNILPPIIRNHRHGNTGFPYHNFHPHFWKYRTMDAICMFLSFLSLWDPRSHLWITVV